MGGGSGVGDLRLARPLARVGVVRMGHDHAAARRAFAELARLIDWDRDARRQQGEIRGACNVRRRRPHTSRNDEHNVHNIRLGMGLGQIDDKSHRGRDTGRDHIRSRRGRSAGTQPRQVAPRLEELRTL
jgi:hypothetical protein